MGWRWCEMCHAYHFGWQACSSATDGANSPVWIRAWRKPNYTEAQLETMDCPLPPDREAQAEALKEAESENPV
jgi:hypothetical protein